MLVRTPRSRLTVRAATAGVQLVQRRDDEGGTVFQLHLLVRDARPVAISPVWVHDRAGLERVAQRLAAITGGRTVNVRGA